MRRPVLNSLCAFAVLSCSVLASSAAIAAKKATSSIGEWTQHGNDSDEQRYSKLKQINVKNVKDLGLAWTADMTETGSWQGTPLMVDGILYATTPWSYLYAFDAKTGKQLWKYSPRVAREIATTQLCCGNQNRGATYWNGKIIWASLDGRLIAVDAKTGKLVWETSTFDPMKDAMSITGAPRVGNGIVFIGQGGGEYHQRGFFSAYDAETGRRLWKFYLVPGNPALGQDGEVSDPVMAMAAKTWKGEWWKTGGGATVWDGIVYDSVNDLVIFGTGNGAPWPAEVRSPGGGDNLFTASIVALHARTGEYAWHYQTVPMESFDLDNTSPLTIADIKIDGKTRRVVMQIPKNGIFYVIEARTGKVVSARPIVPFVNWLTGFDKANNWAPILNPETNYGLTGKGFHVLPFQAHVWTPQSFNPETGLFYVSVRNASYGMVAKAGAKMGNQLLSIDIGAQPQTPRPQITGDTSWLSAWNPATQTEAWRVVGGGSGTMTTAGNLVFQSEGQNLVAYSADKGEKLWTGALGTRAGSGPMSYEIDGEQYIAAIANARVAVFKLGGKAALPAASTTVVARELNPPANFGTEAQLAAGREFYTQSCTICHEGAANIGAPDLRYSPFLATTAAFKAVVLDGAKADGGMKAFGGALTLENAEAIRAHIVSLANTLKNNPAPARGAGPGGPGGFGGGAPRGAGPGGGAPRAGGPGGAPGGAPRAGGPGGAPAAPATPQEPAIGLHQ